MNRGVIGGRKPHRRMIGSQTKGPHIGCHILYACFRRPRCLDLLGRFGVQQYKQAIRAATSQTEPLELLSYPYATATARHCLNG